MQVKDVMSANVITITPDTAVRDIVATLLAHHIGGLPVVDRGRVVGMVGEESFFIATKSERNASDRRPGGSVFWAANRGRLSMSNPTASELATS